MNLDFLLGSVPRNEGQYILSGWWETQRGLFVVIEVPRIENDRAFDC